MEQKVSSRKMMQQKIAVVLAATLMLASLDASARTVYRYTNEAGVKVINDSIPPEYVRGGYEIITYQGEIVNVVPPQLSIDEIEEYNRERERQRLAEEERIRLQKWDEGLLLRYSAVSEIEQAKVRALKVIDVSIQLSQNNLEKLKRDIETQQTEAAEIERKGEEISEVRAATLVAFKEELQLVIQSIAARKKDKISVAEDYEADIERFKMLKAQPQR